MPPPLPTQSASHLFNDERHRVALVHEAQLALGRVRGGRVHEDAAVLERTVHVGHHRADVAAAVRLLQGEESGDTRSVTTAGGGE